MSTLFILPFLLWGAYMDLRKQPTHDALAAERTTP